MEVLSSPAVDAFWSRINQVTISHIINSKNLVRANSELDKGMVQDEPMTPMNYSNAEEEDVVERCEIAYVDDLTV